MTASSIPNESFKKKFGTVQGVYIPNVLQMVGAIFFLRLSWILGCTGMFQMGVIIALSSTLLFLTSLSMTAIVSNMRMRAGGAYYIISRSLGVEFGSAIGVLQFISQLCSIALCVTGFALSLEEVFPEISLPLVKGVTLFALVFVSYISTNLAMKTQMLIFLTLACSIGSIFFAFSGVPEEMPRVMDVSTPLSFWVAFSMFFPATTGIESGMSMSGDLKNPSRSLPIGTILSVVTIFFLYFGLALFLTSRVAEEHLRTNPFLLYHVNRFGFLIMAGVWAATLSSALGAVLGGPRVIQAIAKDGVLPQFLAKGVGPTNEPRTATLFVFALSMGLVFLTDINQIIPMLTMSCLISYALINFIACFEALVQNPSWRPTVQIPWGIPLLGGIGCFSAMFMIDPGATFMVLILVTLLCAWTSSRKVQGNWDDIRYSLISYFVNKGAVRLNSLETDAKNWRPRILAIVDSGVIPKNLAFFAHGLNQGKSLLTFATHSAQEREDRFRKELEENLQGWKIGSYLHINKQADPALAAKQAIENYGFGQLRPNTVLFRIPTSYNIDSLIDLLLDTHLQEKNIILLKDNPQKDFLFADPSRQNKQINLWWRGKYPGNFEFCLATAFLLQQSKFWVRSKISIHMTIKEESMQIGLLEQFKKYRSRLRIKNLEFNTHLDSEGEFFPNLIQSSKNADLTFLGLRKPGLCSSKEEYKEYYLRLLEKTQELENVAYLLSGEKVKFRKIFL